MLAFSTLLLRSYYEAIGWNEDNLYSNITRSSSGKSMSKEGYAFWRLTAALLDFAVPNSLILQLANAPTPIFFTSYALDALPQLNGSLSYITTSEPLTIGPSRAMPFRDVVERFRHFPPPTCPEGKPELWLGGRRVEGRDFLFYSRMHLPTMHLSGLAVTRLAPTLQAHIAFVHQPQRVRFSPPQSSKPNVSAASPSSPPQPPPNLLVALQHDTGRYSGEYTYSAADGMFGMRQLYNFNWSERPEEQSGEDAASGRFSAGGEVYLSVKQRSAGISTGVRYTTLPSKAASGPPSPPTTITLLYNPLIGFVSASYAAQVSPHVAMATRFGVNVYSYESDFAIGGEWWVGRRGGQRQLELSPEARLQIAKHAAIGGRLRDDPVERPAATITGSKAASGAGSEEQMAAQARRDARELATTDPDERDGVLKARLSGNWSLALLYEARIRKCLVSVGLVSDIFGGTGRAIRGVGLEVQYYS